MEPRHTQWYVIIYIHLRREALIWWQNLVGFEQEADNVARLLVKEVVATVGTEVAKDMLLVLAE